MKTTTISGRRPTAAAGAGILAAALLLAAVAPSTADPDSRSSTTTDDGREVFFRETFDGNGRTCATCHDPRNEFTISPDLARKRFEADPDHPLFRAIDSNDGEGRDFTNVLDHALFTVRVPLHENVWPAQNPTQRSITVWRGVPGLANVSITAPFLQDGRTESLTEQAAGAIEDHFEPGRKPKDRELEALELYLGEIFYPLRLGTLFDTGDPIPKEPGFSLPVSHPAILRGKQVFRLHCERCHGGETGNRPLPNERLFANVFVSEANRVGLPLLQLAFRRPDGSVEIVETPDPGRGAISGRLEDLNAFDTPPLRGLKHTAPYFHDNSAATLGEMVEHYDQFLNLGLSELQKRDLIAYLESL